jgi:hypothetical protein
VRGSGLRPVPGAWGRWGPIVPAGDALGCPRSDERERGGTVGTPEIGVSDEGSGRWPSGRSSYPRGLGRSWWRWPRGMTHQAKN